MSNQHKETSMCGCDHCHDHHHAHDEKHQDQEQTEIIGVAVAALIFMTIVARKMVTGQEYNLPMIGAMVVAYLILGWQVIVKAVKNLFTGHMMDENFLMTVATLGAFAIRQFPEAVGVMLFFRIGEAFEDFAVDRSRERIVDAMDLRPEKVNRVNQNGEEESIPAEEAVIGDVLVIRPGDRIPVDGMVLEGESRLDTASVTGESLPVSVKPGMSVLSGCINQTGVLRMRVMHPLSDSMVTRMMRSVENAADHKPQIDSFISRFSKIYTPVVVICAVITAVGIPFGTGQPYMPWVYTALSFLVMSCPCALVLSVPLTFFCGIGTASKHGILFKGGSILEMLTKIKAVILDKTGTITKGDFSVQEIHGANGFSENDLLMLAGAAEKHSTHPVGQSIVMAAESKGMLISEAEKITEKAGFGVCAEVDGKRILCGNIRFMETEGIAIDDALRQSEKAGSIVFTAVDGLFAGWIEIADTVKPEAVSVIKLLKHRGLVPAMLTGDRKENAERVACQVGIDRVYAGLLPEEKLEILQQLRQNTGRALFVGDGINDAPVLAGADVGAAMGSGADAAIEAADVVFLRSDMDAILKAFEIAERTVRIARQNVIFALAIKIAVLLLGMTGIYANMWLSVFADTGVAFLCILNALRMLSYKVK